MRHEVSAVQNYKLPPARSLGDRSPVMLTGVGWQLVTDVPEHSVPPARGLNCLTLEDRTNRLSISVGNKLPTSQQSEGLQATSVTRKTVNVDLLILIQSACRSVNMDVHSIQRIATHFATAT